jgi:hypothetical protein
MKYRVKFEMESDLGDSVSETVQKALVSALGPVSKITIVPVPGYTWYIQLDSPVASSDLRSKQLSK